MTLNGKSEKQLMREHISTISIPNGTSIVASNILENHI